MGNSVQPLNLTTPISSEVIVPKRLEQTQGLPQQIVERKREVVTPAEEVPREDVEKATEKLNRLMGIIDKRLEFRIHEQSHRVMVKVIDQETGDVLDEIPPKRILDILSSFSQVAGIMVDKYV